MQKMEFSFSDFPFGSQIIKDLVNQHSTVKPFVSNFFSLQSIPSQIQSKNFTQEQRKLLVETISAQNESINLSDISIKNVQSLQSDNTFTITTGHQLNLFTGPLFSIYKIAEVISITNSLNKKFVDKHFVPVFWMATEDHDFEEINHIHLFNKKITWEFDSQQKICGAIPISTMTNFVHEIKGLFSDEQSKLKISELTKAYTNSTNLAEATRKIVNHLFSEFGLVILDGNDKKLKQEFAPIFQKEIESNIVFNNVNNTNSQLEKSEYHTQVFVREINLFFIDENNVRHRIQQVENKYQAGTYSWTKEELIKEIEINTHQFSPNALMRPLYQESILPNLVYIGGAGEIAYWLQLKSTFEAMNIPMPMLRVRDSVFVLNQKQVDDLELSNLELNQLNSNIDLLLKNKVMEKLGDDLDIQNELNALNEIKTSFLQKSNAIDKSMSSSVEAEFTRIQQSIEKLQSKLVKSAKAKEENTQNRLTKLKDKLFPENHFQERHENFLAYYTKSENFIEKIIHVLKPEDEPKIRILIL